MGTSMFDIDNIQIGDILVAKSGNHTRWFYVHTFNKDIRCFVLSGIDSSGSPFRKGYWFFDRKATRNEVEEFYKVLRDYGYRLDPNRGVI